jgi:hypothetical protein
VDAIRRLLIGALLGSVLSACSGGSLNPDGPGTAGAAGSAMGAAGAGTGAAGTGGSAAGAGSATTGCARGGTGGSGAGGRGGFGLTDPICPGGLPDCDGSGPVCGNGTADTCLVDVQFGFCPKAVAAEPCDGTDLGQQTCQSQGFGSGALACTTSCAVDITGCRECTADASLLRCGDPPVPTLGTGALALAATDNEVALAWAEWPEGGRLALRFARLSPGLDLSSSATLDEPVFAAVTDGINSGSWLFAAPLPSGWVVAGFAENEVFVHAVDATGHGVSRIAPADIPAGLLALARRPGGGPLLVSKGSDGAWASVIAADGRSATPAIRLPVDTSAVAGEMTAAFVGDAFYVAAAVYDDVTNAVSAHLRLVRVAPDGTSATGIDALPGTEVWQPYIVEDTDILRIVHVGMFPCVPEYSLLIQSVDRGGAALAPARLFAEIPTGWLWRALPTAFGRDVVMLLLGGGDGERLTLMRRPLDGSGAPSLHTIGRAPPQTFFLGTMARRGPDAIVAWTDYARPEIQLARVAP